MFRSTRVCWILALAFLCSQAGCATGPEGTPRARRPFAEKDSGQWALKLIHGHAVRKELKLTDRQLKKVDDWLNDLLYKHPPKYKKYTDKEWKEHLNTESEEINKFLAGVLTPDQEDRLHQLLTQWQGVGAFMAPEIQSALKLSAEQREKIKTIVMGADKNEQERLHGGSQERESFEAIRKENIEKAIAVLTDEQKKTWRDLIGESFSFALR